MQNVSRAVGIACTAGMSSGNAFAYRSARRFRMALDIKSSMIASLKTASLTFFVGMHPFARRDRARLGQLDHFSGQVSFGVRLRRSSLLERYCYTRQGKRHG